MLLNAPTQGLGRNLNEEYHDDRARAVVLGILADPNGGGMSWAGGDPTGRACMVADRIIRELTAGGF